MAFILGILAGAVCSVGFLLWFWRPEEWTMRAIQQWAFTYARDDKLFGGWFRIFGRGFVLTDHRVHPALFSERYGYVKAIHLGPYCVRWLGKMRYLRGDTDAAVVAGEIMRSRKKVSRSLVAYGKRK